MFLYLLFKSTLMTSCLLSQQLRCSVCSTSNNILVITLNIQSEYLVSELQISASETMCFHGNTIH